MNTLSAETLKRSRTRAFDIVPVMAAVVFSMGVSAELAKASSRAGDLLATGSEFVAAVRCSMGGLLTDDQACAARAPLPVPPVVPSPTLG